MYTYLDKTIIFMLVGDRSSLPDNIQKISGNDYAV